MDYGREQLARYLDRIGVAAIDGAGAATLAAVQRGHRLSIPFENLDIPLGRGIALAPDRLFDKLVTRRRGGYCFEQNSLFLGMLRALSFEARPLLGRVWLMAEDTPPRTHTLNFVRLDGADFIADAGFGGSYVPPMPLVDGREEIGPDGVRHRLLADADHGWMLERDAGTGWARQYSFTLDPAWPADLEAANHWTSTRPGTRCTTLRVASIVLEDGYASLVDRTLTVSRADETFVSEIDDAAAYRQALGRHFGLSLDEAEVAALGLFPVRA